MMQESSSATVLVVDDDVVARSVLADYLRQCGFRVLEVGTGRDAIAALERTELGIDIVLSDVELPGDMTGFALSRWVRGSRPDVTMLLAGAIERAAETAGALCDEGPELSKPYDPGLIADHIRRLRGG